MASLLELSYIVLPDPSFLSTMDLRYKKHLVAQQPDHICQKSWKELQIYIPQKLQDFSYVTDMKESSSQKNCLRLKSRWKKKYLNKHFLTWMMQPLKIKITMLKNKWLVLSKIPRSNGLPPSSVLRTQQWPSASLLQLLFLFFHYQVSTSKIQLILLSEHHRISKRILFIF